MTNEELDSILPQLLRAAIGYRMTAYNTLSFAPSFDPRSPADVTWAKVLCCVQFPGHDFKAAKIIDDQGKIRYRRMPCPTTQY